MSINKSAANLKRRGFLVAGSVGAVGVVAAVVAPTIQRVAPAAAALPKTSDVGYHESDHVRTYYDLARV